MPALSSRAIAAARRAQSAVSDSSCLRPARIGRLLPLGVEPAGAFQALQGRQERPGVDLEHAAGDLLDAPSDAEAVHRLEAERLEDEHVERALDDVGTRSVGHRGRRYQGLILIVKM